jgi:hypothetical protein
MTTEEKEGAFSLRESERRHLQGLWLVLFVFERKQEGKRTKPFERGTKRKVITVERRERKPPQSKRE